MKKLILPLFLCLFFLCGCSGSKEIDDRAYVTAIGIDSTEENTFNITFVTAIPANINSESGGGKPVSFSTVNAENIFTAGEKISSKLNRKTDFSHCKLIAFSQEIASKDLNYFKKTLLNEKSFRPNTLIAVTKGETSDFFKNSSSAFEANPAKYFELMFNSHNTANSVSCSLKDFSGGRENILPLAYDGAIDGCVIIKNGKAVSTLNNDEVILYKILSGKYNNGYIDFSEENATLFLNQEKAPDIKISANNKLKINITLHLTGELIAEDKTLSHEKFINEIKKKCLNFLYYTSKEINCDVLNILNMTRMDFLTLDSFKNYAPEKKYEDAEFNIKIIYSDLKTGERNLKL